MKLKPGQKAKSTADTEEKIDKSIDARITFLRGLISNGIPDEYKNLKFTIDQIRRWKFPEHEIYPIGSRNTLVQRKEKVEVIKSLVKSVLEVRQSPDNTRLRNETLAAKNREIKALKDELQRSTDILIFQRAERIELLRLINQFSENDKVRQSAIRRHFRRWGISEIVPQASNDPDWSDGHS